MIIGFRVEGLGYITDNKIPRYNTIQQERRIKWTRQSCLKKKLYDHSSYDVQLVWGLWEIKRLRCDDDVGVGQVSKSCVPCGIILHIHGSALRGKVGCCLETWLEGPWREMIGNYAGYLALTTCLKRSHRPYLHLRSLPCTPSDVLPCGFGVAFGVYHSYTRTIRDQGLIRLLHCHLF